MHSNKDESKNKEQTAVPDRVLLFLFKIVLYYICALRYELDSKR